MPNTEEQSKLIQRTILSVPNVIYEKFHVRNVKGDTQDAESSANTGNGLKPVEATAYGKFLTETVNLADEDESDEEANEEEGETDNILDEEDDTGNEKAVENEHEHFQDLEESNCDPIEYLEEDVESFAPDE